MSHDCAGVDTLLAQLTKYIQYSQNITARRNTVFGLWKEMSEELTDEVTSINAIYGDDTLSSLSIDGHPGLFSLTLPVQPTIILRLDFPPNYPDSPPAVLGTQSIGDNDKGAGTFLVDLVRDVLASVYIPGASCVFDLVEEADQRLQQLGLDQSGTEAEEQQTAQTDGQALEHLPGHKSSDTAQSSLDDSSGDPPPWTLSDVLTEKKSIFIARSAPVTSVDQALQYLNHLLSTDKKVAKATHNITAWRIRGDHGVQFQDCDDDGETAAGGRVLHLMELMNVWGVMVVVTRWYGGVQLGPDRFRLINQAARDAMVKGGSAVEAAKDGGKKKGKK
ncbi:hypothetical protein LTR53_010049 [Teratosphaeriaceae sp. CCFEE 6253]|nr:hypothetical protein LTR53_010049 [Teratosphaeriaceae sp. CCFEE 6253]